MPEQCEDHRGRGKKHDVISQRAAIKFEAEYILRDQDRAGAKQFRKLEAAPVIATGEPR